MKKQSFADILNGISEAGSARVFKKVPAWAGVPGLEFPSRLSMEQCSSQATALYKAVVAKGTAGGSGGIIELTGGLGVDCWAFSREFSRVHHNEMNVELSEAVRHNFSLLGVCNASFSSIEVQPGNIGEVISAAGFSPDLIFLDPARRSDTGRKVFLLEDCRPDILGLKDELLTAAPEVLVKLSPMADITMVCRRLGAEVREVHAVGAAGECKELLIRLQRGWTGGYTIICANADTPAADAGTLIFTPEEEASAVPSFLQDSSSLEGGWLFEPSAAVLKAGCFNLLCSRLGLRKFARFTHLYYTDSPAPCLPAFGKLFRINQVHPFENSILKTLGRDLGPCEVTARNLPITSDALRKKLGAASGGNAHVFAFTADFASGSRRLLLVCSKLT